MAGLNFSIVITDNLYLFQGIMNYYQFHSYAWGGHWDGSSPFEVYNVDNVTYRGSSRCGS